MREFPFPVLPSPYLPLRLQHEKNGNVQYSNLVQEAVQEEVCGDL